MIIPNLDSDSIAEQNNSTTRQNKQQQIANKQTETFCSFSMVSNPSLESDSLQVTFLKICYILSLYVS